MGLVRIGRALAAPFLRAGASYNAVAVKAPFAVGVATTVIKTSAADLFAQKVIERREDIDWKRNALFTGFGFAYLGCFQFWLYNDLFVRICKPITAVVGHYGSAPIKTFIDQCIHHPLFYFPCFYALKGSVEGRTLSSSLALYREDMWENCKALWTVWVPAQLVNFSVVPLHLRIPFVAGVSFAWTVIISVMRGSLKDCTVDDPAEVPVMLQQQLHTELSGQAVMVHTPDDSDAAVVDSTLDTAVGPTLDLAVGPALLTAVVGPTLDSAVAAAGAAAGPAAGGSGGGGGMQVAGGLAMQGHIMQEYGVPGHVMQGHVMQAADYRGLGHATTVMSVGGPGVGMTVVASSAE